jgi:hypothetical protein
VADWHWECLRDDLLDGLPAEAVRELEQLVNEIAVRDSMIFLDGRAYEGPTPGLRTEERGRLMIEYVTDVRGERIVVVQVTWFG